MPSEAKPEPVASASPPTAPVDHSLSPIQSETNRVRTYSQPIVQTETTVRRRTASDSRIRRNIIQDISTRVTSALQTALEDLLKDEPTSDDSFEHIPDLEPIDSTGSPVTQPKNRTKK